MLHRPVTLLRTLVALLAYTVVAPGCLAAPQAASLEEAMRESGELQTPALLLHYHRPEGDYTDWNAWTWADGAQGQGVGIAQQTGFGGLIVIPVSEEASRQGFLLRRGDWAGRDVMMDRFVELDDDGITEVWVVAGDPRIFTDPADVDLSVRVAAAFLDDSDSVFFTATGLLDADQLSGAVVLTGGVPNRYRARAVERTDPRDASGIVYELVLDREVDFKDVARLSIAIPGTEPVTVFARDVLNEDRFIDLDARLGPDYTRSSTTFRVWSPVSERVEVLTYARHNSPQPANFHPMTHTGNGVWEATVQGDLHNTAYQITYESYGEVRTAADIHSFAATVDSQRSVVVDLDRTDPPGWGAVPAPVLAQPTDEIIYEIHVRDLSVRDDSLPERLRGTYAGLVNRGTVETPLGEVRTGLNYIEDLGVTAVHLLPVQDFTAPVGQYNWGYWTALFNVPEANYASDPFNPLSPIVDLKAAIQGLHKAEIRVILDVVYNHTSSSFTYSPFDQSVPFYYFRTTMDGKLRNDAGVGNSIADERPMVSKYISDSLVYWVEEYNVDGYRFDLIGTHRPESVRAWVARLREIRPDITIYGEPWTGGGPVYFPKGAQRSMGLAVFNDHLRNAMRGDLDGDAIGFSTGPGGDTGAVRRGVMGAIDDFTDAPTETINYVSAHDNLTLWDKILRVTPAASDATRREMQKLSLGVVLTSQGIAFLHGGSPFARTKGGNHNSYDSGDDVNLYDWPRRAEYDDVLQYTKGLIALRNARPAFRMSERDDVRRAIEWRSSPAGTVAYTIDGRVSGDEWETIFVAYNGEPTRKGVDLPEGTWNVVVTSDQAGTETIRTAEGDYVLPPYSMVVLYK